MVAVYPNQLAQRLSPLPVLVLLWGDDAGALRHAAQQCITATGVDPADPFASEKLGLAEIVADPARLPDSAQTLSFTSPHRLILVQGISGNETKDALAPLTESVKTALSLPLSAVTIVITVPRLLEKTSPLVKVAEAHPNALSVRFFTDKAADLTPFLQNELKALGKGITPEALQALAAGLGADREIARREVEKLALYAGEENPITEDHVTASLAGAIPADAFRLAEAVGARNPAQTDLLLQHLLQQGEDLNTAFSLALRHLQGLKTAQTQRKAGADDSALLQQSGKIRAPKDAQQAFLAQVRNYPPARLASLETYALEALTQSRSGLLDPNLVLSRALLALST